MLDACVKYRARKYETPPPRATTPCISKGGGGGSVYEFWCIDLSHLSNGTLDRDLGGNNKGKKLTFISRHALRNAGGKQRGEEGGKEGRRGKEDELNATFTLVPVRSNCGTFN